MSTIKHTEKFKINQPVEILFPLFSAEGEKLWVPGWDYENIMGSTDLHENYVFLTKNHDHATNDAIWLVKQYEPKFYLVQFYKVEPGDKVGVITVQCTKFAKCITQVEVSYEYISLSKKGDEFIKSFTSTEYKAFIGEWNSLLISYFESKC
ncbi:MAG: hypothetical protein ABFR31_07700 [Thermodesulfobacteriota bacterium]